MNARCFKLAAVLVALAGCAQQKQIDLTQTTLEEGRGMGPLEVGKTSLEKALKILGPDAKSFTTPYKTVVEAPPLRLEFVAPKSGGDPVPQSIVAERTTIPGRPHYTGKTRRGIGYLDTVERMPL
jgi:hypothetical protein